MATTNTTSQAQNTHYQLFQERVKKLLQDEKFNKFMYMIPRTPIQKLLIYSKQLAKIAEQIVKETTYAYTVNYRIESILDRISKYGFCEYAYLGEGYISKYTEEFVCQTQYELIPVYKTIEDAFELFHLMLYDIHNLMNSLDNKLDYEPSKLYEILKIID